MSEASAPAAVRPQIHVRAIETPPGAPWDQGRAARMDALHGAPLPMDQLVMQLRRVEPWRPSTGGAFAVAYARASDLEGEVRHVATLSGRRIRFVFAEPGQVARQTRSAALIGACAVALFASAALAGLRSYQARSANEAVISRLELNAKRQVHQQRKIQKAIAEQRVIQSAGADGHSFSALAADLAWLGQAKSSTAVVQRVVWGPQAMQIVSLGPDVPILGGERAVEAVERRAAGAAVWKIGSAPRPIVRGGVLRPSVVDRPNAVSSERP